MKRILSFTVTAILSTTPPLVFQIELTAINVIANISMMSQSSSVKIKKYYLKVLQVCNLDYVNETSLSLIRNE